tara:strand:- start:40058 stop:40705 length:648 start_codon:yes stop_codon:yes gene_type:complete
MKTLFVLCSSLIVNKPIFKKHKIGLQYGKSRLDQYENGFKILLDKNIYNNFDKTLLVDNTLDSEVNIPVNIRSLLIDEMEYFLFKENKLGVLNKGAGVLDSLIRVKDFMKHYDYVIYFEPKLWVSNTMFFETIKEMPRNLFYEVEEYPQVKSGHFCSNTQDLVDFIESVDISLMIRNKINLENLIFDFYKNRNSEFIKGSFTKRYDPYNDRMIDY